MIAKVLSFLTEFLEEATGKSSMTRLVTLLLCLSAVLVAVAFAIVALENPEKLTTTVVSGFVGVLGALVASGVVALINRTPSGPAGR